MRNPSRSIRRALAALPIVACLGLAYPTPAASAGQNGTHAEQAAAKQKLADLRRKMEALAAEQADTAARRDSVNAELAKQANALAAAARAVREADAALATAQKQLDDLRKQRDTLQGELQHQRAAIADLLRATYALGHGSDLRLLLGDEDVARVARALVYSQYFQRDRVQRVEKLMGDLARLQELESSIAAQQQALQATKAEREEQAKKLAAQRAARQKLAAETDAKYKDQAQRLAAMKQNAQSLNQLLDKLQKAIDEAAAPSRGQPPPSRAADIRGKLP
ncbi:MAG: peptidase M23, partial [Rhodanobacter sp.]